LPELLIFDLDGTLVDSRRDIALAVNLTLDEMGFPRREPRVIFGFIGSGVHKLILNSLPEGRADLVDRGVEIFWGYYREHALDTTALYPGISDMLGSLSGVKLAVATNKPYTHTVLVLDGLDITRYFASVQGWKPGLPVKPDPALLVRALDEAGGSRADAVMVGDGLNDIMAARAAGVKSCAVGYGYGKKEALLEAAPDYFAETVADLARLLGPGVR